jgi:hypothetical protein
MPPPFAHTIGTTTYRSDELPEDLPASCDQVLAAFRRAEIPSVALLHEWHRILPSMSALLKIHEADAIAHWSFRRLSRAAHTGDHALAHHLIRGRLHLLAESQYTEPAIHATIWGTHTYALQLMLHDGQAIGSRDRILQMTPLHLAAHRGCRAAIGILLSWGADFEARNAYGYTPLHCAAVAEDQDLAIVRALARHGADLTARTTKGYTPRELARTCGNRRVARELERLECGTEPPDPDNLGYQLAFRW